MAPVRSSERFTAEVDQINEAGWNSLLKGFADATVYQTWSYGAVCWSDRQLSHLVLKEGSVPVGLAQLRIVRVPIVGSGIAYLRWGPLCRRERSVWQPAVWQAMIEALVDEYAVRRGLLLRVIPHVFQQDAWAAEMGLLLNQTGFREDPTVRKYKTQRVSLKPSVED